MSNGQDEGALKELRWIELIAKRATSRKCAKRNSPTKVLIFCGMQDVYLYFFHRYAPKKAQYPRKMHISQKKLADNLVDSEKCISFANANEEQQTTTSKLQSQFL